MLNSTDFEKGVFLHVNDQIISTFKKNSEKKFTFAETVKIRDLWKIENYE